MACVSSAAGQGVDDREAHAAHGRRQAADQRQRHRQHEADQQHRTCLDVEADPGLDQRERPGRPGQGRWRPRTGRGSAPRPARSAITAPSVKPSVFSTASSGVRSRTDCIITAPTEKSRAKNTAPTMARTTKPMSPICLIEFGDQLALALGLGLVGRVGEQRVDAVGDRRWSGRIGQPDQEDAGGAVGLGAALVDVVVVRQQRRAEQDVARIGLEDADHVQRPHVGAVAIGP